jgi:hypothetical protein
MVGHFSLNGLFGEGEGKEEFRRNAGQGINGSEAEPSVVSRLTEQDASCRSQLVQFCQPGLDQPAADALSLIGGMNGYGSQTVPIALFSIDGYEELIIVSRIIATPIV